jgi:antitoxin component YwqK of YwqJK toxin-antitoxin module
MGMELRSLIWKLLKEQLDQNTINLKNKYVGDGKPVSEEDFNKIVDVTGNKFYLLSWLTKKVGTGLIKSEDIYKYKEYFNLFEKNKNKFQHKDIHLYKTAEDVKKFLQEIFAVREGDIVFDEIQGQDNFVSQNEVEKLEKSGGVKYLGLFDNENYKYQVFQIFGVNQNVWKLYRDILGRCKGRSRGASIDICTIADYSYFKRYLSDPKGSSYFLLYNLNDRKSPYQLHFESGQLVDKNDDEDTKIKEYKFFEFVGKRVPRYNQENQNLPSGFEIPVVGKGTLNSKGNKEGLWRQNFSKGNLETLTTYKDGKLEGPFATFFTNGKLQSKGTHGKKHNVEGEYTLFYNNGQIDEKGIYKGNERVGVWIYGFQDGSYRAIDHSSQPSMMSGYTKSGFLDYVSEVRKGEKSAYGKSMKFYRSGKLKGIGKIGATGPLGEWEWFTPNGKIKSKGKYLRGQRTGEWTDLVTLKNDESYYFVGNFKNGQVQPNIKVYNLKGDFLKKIKKPGKINPSHYWYGFENLWYN